MLKMHLSTLVGSGAVLLFASTASATPPTSAPRAPAVIAAEHPVAAPPPAADADKPAPNSVNAEGLGAGLAYSINDERLILDELGVRAGFGYWGASASATVNGQTTSAGASFLTIPITVSYIGVRSGKHSLELGGGATI